METLTRASLHSDTSDQFTKFIVQSIKPIASASLAVIATKLAFFADKKIFYTKPAKNNKLNKSAKIGAKIFTHF